MHCHPTHGSLGPHESQSQTASRSVQPFLQGSPNRHRPAHATCMRHLHYNSPHLSHCLHCWRCGLKLDEKAQPNRMKRTVRFGGVLHSGTYPVTARGHVTSTHPSVFLEQLTVTGPWNGAESRDPFTVISKLPLHV